MLTAVLARFLTYTYLEPLFVPVHSETAMVFLYILSIDSGFVGMSLGVLLPLVLPGACLGGVIGLLGCAIAGVWNSYLFPIVGGVLALLFALVSARYVVILSGSSFLRCMLKCSLTSLTFPYRYDSVVILSLASALEGGAVASCFLLKAMLPY